MDYEYLNERIKVRVDMSPGGTLTPLKFKHKDREYKVDKIHSTWIDSSNRDKRYYFSVESQGCIYHLLWRAVALY